MKRLTPLLMLCCLAVPTLSDAALPGDTQWEVRTTGNDNNGGCYDEGGTGTDFSQQDASQLALTDLATSGAGSTTLTSATGGFTSTMVDNCIQIRSGTNFDVGFYEITVHTDTNTVTLDRTPTSAGAGSSGAGDVGGALLTISKADAEVAAGHHVYVQDGNYAENVSLSVSAGGGDYIIFEGYASTRGDRPTDSTRPNVIPTSGNVWAGGTTRGNVVRNFIFDGSSGAVDGWTSSSGSTSFFILIQNRATGLSDQGFRPGGAQIFECESDSNDDGFYINNSNGVFNIFWSYSHDNTTLGVASNQDPANAYMTVSDSNGSEGFQTERPGTMLNNIAYNNSGVSTDGFQLEGSNCCPGNGYVAVNNIANDNGNYGFNETQTYEEAVFDYNLYEGNTTGGLNNIVAGDNDSTADPSFTDAVGGDFTAASGSPLLGAGALQTYPGATGDYQWNIGVDQDDVAAAAAGGAGGWGF